MGYKPLSNNNPTTEIFSFKNAGDSFEGTITGIRRKVTTKNGLADIADVMDLEGKEYSIFITAGLTSRLTDDLIGERVLIEYTGEQKNEKSGRKFKAFDVSVWSDDDDQPF